MATYAIFLIDRTAKGNVEAFQWMSKPDLSYEEAEAQCAILQQTYGMSVEVHPTRQGFNVWSASIGGFWHTQR